MFFFINLKEGFLVGKGKEFEIETGFFTAWKRLLRWSDFVGDEELRSACFY